MMANSRVSSGMTFCFCFFFSIIKIVNHSTYKKIIINLIPVYYPYFLPYLITYAFLLRKYPVDTDDVPQRCQQFSNGNESSQLGFFTAETESHIKFNTWNHLLLITYIFLIIYTVNHHFHTTYIFLIVYTVSGFDTFNILYLIKTILI